MEPWWGVVGCGVAGVKRLRAPPQGTPTLNSSTRVANAQNEQSTPASQANALALHATGPPFQRRYKPCLYKPAAQARARPPSTALQAAPRRHVPPQTPPPKSAPTPSQRAHRFEPRVAASRGTLGKRFINPRTPKACNQSLRMPASQANSLALPAERPPLQRRYADRRLSPARFQRALKDLASAACA